MQHGHMTEHDSNITRLDDRRLPWIHGRFMENSPAKDDDSAANEGENVGAPSVSEDKPILRDAKGRILKGSRRLNPEFKPRQRTLTGELEKQLDKGDTRAQAVAVLIEKALAGNDWALRMLFDRTEGKAIDRKQIDSAVSHIQLDWSRTPELQQSIEVRELPPGDPDDDD